VLELAAERRELARPIAPGRSDLLAEAVIAARHEQARSVEDVLLRRTRLGILAAPELRSADSVRAVAEAMGSELGWKGRRRRRESEAWVEAVASEGIDPASGVS
jgi:glycerol-3-phosphate dehydrogenase